MALVAVVGLFLDFDQALRSYLTAYLYWVGVGTGCLGLLLMQHISGGVWGATLRRFLEAGASTLFLLALLFIPILLEVVVGNHILYAWTNPEIMAESAVLQNKTLYLNVPFFLVRMALYFAFFLFVTYRLIRLSRRRDADPSDEANARLVRFSAPMMVLYVVVMTGFGTDMVMSLEPDWYSTIFPVIYAMTGILSAFALMIVALAVLGDRGPLRGIIGPEHYHDLGKLLLAFVILWTYFSFSQFIIIWSGNLPIEVLYYAHRIRGGWGYVGIALVALQFVLPFLLLLSRDLKRSAKTLVPVAALIGVMQLVYVFYLTQPSYHTEGFHISIWDLVMPVAMGGVWLWVFLGRLASAPLLPLNVVPVRHPRAHTGMETELAGH